MAVPGLTDANSANVEIKAPTLNTTKVTFTGAFIVGVVAPILAFVSGQDAAVQQMALLISLVAIPSVAFVVGIDTITRGYVTVGDARGKASAPASSTADTAKGVLGSGIAVFDRDIEVKVAGEGDRPFQALAIRRNSSGKDELLLARGDSLRWMDEEKIDQFVSARP